jgi:hypothetical protein
MVAHFVMRATASASVFELPAVDDVADEIDGVGIVQWRKSSSSLAWHPRVPR